MRFNLDTSGSFYNEEEKSELEELGFVFDQRPEPGRAWHKSWDQEIYIDFNSLDDLIKFIKKYGQVVISPPEKEGWGWDIEIYDDYRE